MKKKIKKTKKINPSTKRAYLRHKIVEKQLLENIGKGKGASISKAMRDSKLFSPSYCKNPQVLTSSRSWDIILKEDFSDEKLAKKHQQILDKEELAIASFHGDITIEKTGQPHSDVKSALDMMYKIKGKYAPEEFNMKFKGFSKTQLVERLLSKITKPKK